MTYMKSTLLALVASTAVAVPALASSTSLANDIGVEPGLYSMEQLLILKDAGDEKSAQIKYVLSNPEGPLATENDTASRSDAALQVKPVNGSVEKLARAVGVEPGLYSLEQLIALKAAQDSDDHSTQRYILANPQG